MLTNQRLYMANQSEYLQKELRKNINLLHKCVKIKLNAVLKLYK